MIQAFKDIRGRVKLEADVVVVGSGAGGAVAAHRLRKAGKSVILLEEGSYIQPEQFTTDSWAAMRQLYRDNGMRAMVGTMVIPTMQARCVGGPPSSTPRSVSACPTTCWRDGWPKRACVGFPRGPGPIFPKSRP